MTSEAATATWEPPAHANPVRRIYLDQNAWIQLARQHFGKSHDPQMAEALRLVQQHASSGISSFPLSASHYFETLKRGDPAARRRLGGFMFSIAGLDRISDGSRLLLAELHTAIAPTSTCRHPRRHSRSGEAWPTRSPKPATPTARQAYAQPSKPGDGVRWRT